MASRKPLVAIVVGTIGLALVGLGVRASFTSSVDVTQTISTGNVNALIIDATWQTAGEGLTQPVEVGGAPFNPGVSSVDLGTSANNGSNILEVFNITVENSGSLDMTLNCTLSPGPADNNEGSNFALNDELSVTDPNADVSAFGSVSQVESQGINVCAANTDTIPAGGTVVVSIEFFSPYGGLDNDAQGGSVSPVLTIGGSDLGGQNNPPTLPAVPCSPCR